MIKFNKKNKGFELGAKKISLVFEVYFFQTQSILFRSLHFDTKFYFCHIQFFKGERKLFKIEKERESIWLSTLQPPKKSNLSVSLVILDREVQ